MTTFRPFRPLRPTPEAASRVAAPPYDVVSREEARALAEGNPDSFLRVGRADLELDDAVDCYGEEVYARGRANLEGLVARGVMRREPEPMMALYRQAMAGRTQSGFVGLAAVSDYDAGAVKKHELTRPDKEQDRVRVIEAHASQSGPVFLAYRDSEALARVRAEVEGESAEIDFVAPDGVRHSVWPIREPALIARIEAAFAELPALYIADGHHRAAAASRVHARRRDEASAGFLAVCFPAKDLTILPYNRVVRHLGGLDPEAFLAEVSVPYRVERGGSPGAPPLGGFTCFVGGGWHNATPRATTVPGDPVGRLAVSMFSDNVLEPIVGIRNQRTDKAIDFVGGVRGPEAIEALVRSGEWAAGFVMSPTTMGELLAVADAGAIMPPKSTWFEPKLRDGLFVHLLDDSL
jgi:uncharacterized protein (DUF1015 family)